MNNQANSQCPVKQQSAFDDAFSKLRDEQGHSELLIGNLFGKLDRALEAPFPTGCVDDSAVPARAAICHDIYTALEAQVRLNNALQEIISRLAI